MNPIDIHEAEIRFPELVEALETGRESEIVLTGNGKPAARLVSAMSGGATGPNGRAPHKEEDAASVSHNPSAP